MTFNPLHAQRRLQRFPAAYGLLLGNREETSGLRPLRESKLYSKDSHKHTGSYGRTDNARYIWAHRMHQQEVGRIFFRPDLLGHTRRHRHCGHAGRTNQRVNLAASKLAQQLPEPTMNAIKPRATIFNVVIFRNASALVVAPTEVPSRITTMYIIALEAVSDS